MVSDCCSMISIAPPCIAHFLRNAPSSNTVIKRDWQTSWRSKLKFSLSRATFPGRYLSHPALASSQIDGGMPIVTQNSNWSCACFPDFLRVPTALAHWTSCDILHHTLHAGHEEMFPYLFRTPSCNASMPSPRQKGCGLGANASLISNTWRLTSLGNIIPQRSRCIWRQQRLQSKRQLG
jgi:hypothetical protein